VEVLFATTICISSTTITTRLGISSTTITTAISSLVIPVDFPNPSSFEM
jgi:hypothetical protein